MSTNHNSLPTFENLALRGNKANDGVVAHPPPPPETRDASQRMMENVKRQKDASDTRKAEKAARHQEYLAREKVWKDQKAARHQEQLDRAQARRERRALVEKAKEVADPTLVGRCRRARHRMAVRKGKERKLEREKRGQGRSTGAVEASMAFEAEVVPRLMTDAEEHRVAERRVGEMMEGVESLEIDEA